ncbi:MAG: hypothetical protein BM564_09700 [Bacteroidetes bacterium MedPE-SWsnd-G2]|nr:MAG: hypothetical protein BM564_09700 [Bacteroidetes bacterium MedPE-SWsnd-G2]
MKNNKLNNNISSGHLVPDNYFASLNDNLIEKLNLNSEHKTGHVMPEGYLDKLQDKILASTKETLPKETKVRTMFPPNMLWYASGIAASILILLSIFTTSIESTNLETIETVSIENYLFEESYTSYDLASLLEDEDLTFDNIINDPITDEYLQSYLLENSDIEDLILD